MSVCGTCIFSGCWVFAGSWWKRLERLSARTAGGLERSAHTKEEHKQSALNTVGRPMEHAVIFA